MSSGMNHLALCAALAAGEACGFASSRASALWPLAVVAALAVWLAALAFRPRGGRFAVVFAAGFALALAAAEARRLTLSEALDRSCGAPFAREFSVEGDVRSHPSEEGSAWTSFASSVGSVKVRVVFQLAEGEAIPEVGETWACAGWLERMKVDDPSRRRALWVKGRGTYARRVASVPRGSPVAILDSVRRELSRRMGIGLDGSETVANLNRAILLGERGRLPRGERNAFVSAGTIHVFAISGLHVMVVAETLAFLLLLAGMPVRSLAFVLVPVLWLYVAMTGASPSAVRAAAMASLGYAAPAFWRRRDGLVAWSLTFLAVYAMDPMKVFDVGCALSFAVMLGLVLWGRFVSEFVHGRIASAFVMTLAAWAVGMPIAAHAFGRVTPGGLIANIALIPAAGLGVKASMAGLAASFVSERLAAHVNAFAALVANAMSGLSHIVASLPWANFEVAPWPVHVCVEWYAAMALSLWLLSSVLRRRRAAGCLSAAPAEDSMRHISSDGSRA